MQPRATYRLQLRPGFGFDQVAELADYLAELGVTHAYLSPYLQAAPGSSHGYDVVDPTALNRELGGEAGHARMLAALRAHGLGQLVDVVPNHMAIHTPENRFWWDLLEHGPCSRYAEYFDVDWFPLEPRLRGKVLLPILGDHYGRVLESGAMAAARDGARFLVRVYDSHVLPLEPGSAGELLARAAKRCASPELAFVADALRRLPGPTDTAQDSRELRYRDAQVLERLLARLMAEHPEVEPAIDAALAELNANGDALADLLERQNYRLSFWRVARYELDYRRFFDIDALAAVRVERPEVFARTHARVLEFVQRGEADGLRIDHPDGLRDPTAYLCRLREHAKDAWIVVEKILNPAASEQLPASWPVDGTTGYEFADLVTALFVDAAAEPALTELYADFTGERRDFATLARDKKRFALDELLASDLNRLTSVLVDICEHTPRFRDYSRPELRAALRELIACLPVYRTYVTPGTQASEPDRARIAHAVELAGRAEPPIDPRLLGFLARILRGEHEGPRARELCARFQQLSSAAMAKGVEDTAFYNYARFVALNEVGGDPGRFGVTVEQFHAFCMRAARERPLGLLASSTHDSKRSEDVRARLALLSEIPDAWRQAVLRWSARAARYRSSELPDRELEYLFWQTLLGAFPIEEARLLGYLEKAMREAKAHTSWHRKDEAYERAALDFARGVLRERELMRDVAALAAELAAPARRNSLAQLVLKLTAPGVPDLYQGNEAFRHDLTDPDNRRPVDYAALREKLRRSRELDAQAVLRDADADLQKLFVTQRLLHLRKAVPDAFRPGADYAPLSVQGAGAAHVVAFMRGGRVAVVVPRLLLAAPRALEAAAVELPAGTFRHCFTGERVRGGAVAAMALLAPFPVAVLRAE